MSWFNTKDLRSTLTAIFTVSTAPEPDPAEQAERLDQLRRQMLAMALESQGERSELLVRRIRYAVSVESLWYARGALMGQLAKLHGEALARDQVDALEPQFTALLPRGLRSRPSPLDGTYRSSRPPET